MVLLKPNWVRGGHPRDPHGWKYTVTHGSVVRAVGEYVALALKGEGRIVIGDGPQTDSDFWQIAELTGTVAVAQELRRRGIDVELVDFRKEQWEARDGVIVGRRELAGDPRGYVAFDLGDRSRLAGHVGAGRYYGAFYDAGEVNRHHTEGRHEYLIAGSAIAADVFINLPKLKTHKKTGVTLNLKNLVGINGDKNWLPHHTEGVPRDGGDQFPGWTLGRWLELRGGRILRSLAMRLPYAGPWLLARAREAGARVLGDTDTVIRSGNWSGNDTTWRMALDLNTILLYGREDGTFRDPGQRKPYLSFVDGVLAGEGAGPLNPDPVPAGVLAFGANPAAVDAVCAWLMGFDPGRLPVVREAFARMALPIATGSWRDVLVESNIVGWNGRLCDIPDESCFRFRPHFGWRGAIERRAL
jgi:uncharacterized protein (DUF362 family)